MRVFLIFGNGICAGWAGFIFLYFFKYNFISWAMANVSSMIQVLAAFALILGKRVLMSIFIPLLLFYGAEGLFLLNWSSSAIPAQITHSIMVLTALYIIYFMIADLHIGKLTIGIMLGIILFVPLRVGETYYSKFHPEVKSYLEFFKGK